MKLMKSKLFMLTAGLAKVLAPGAAAAVSTELFQTQSITPTGLTNSYGGVTVQAGDAIVMTAGSNKKYSAAPISFSSTAGTFVPVNTAGLGDPYPAAYTAYLIVQESGTYDFQAAASGSLYANTGLYVLRADSGTLSLLDSATYANNDGDSEADQTLLYDWGGTAVTNAAVIEAVSSRTSLITPANATIDANAADKRLLCSTNISDTAFSSTYSFAGGTAGAMTTSGAGLIFSENEGALPPAPISPSEGTNILFIAIDDMKTLMGCYGDTQALTPRIDGLASNGVTFLNAQCQWAVCGPSRASLMTGLMPEQIGVMGFVKMRDNSRAKLHDVVTLPQHFKNNGYATAATGKLNDPRCVGSINPDGTVNDDGATVDDPPSWSVPYVKAASGLGSTSAYSPDLEKTVKLAAERVDLPDSSFGDGAACDEGITLLQNLAAGDTQFFLGVGFKKPHMPFLAPRQYWDLYNRDDFTPHPFQTEMANVTGYTFNYITELRDNYYIETNALGQALLITDGILPDEQQKLLLHGYYACASFADALVGHLLDELETLGLHTNTIVVLWGDHGFHLGDHNEWGKHTNLEQASRVPLIIHNPFGGISNATATGPAAFVDLYPTLCELAGLTIPTQPIDENTPTGRPLAGRSLVPILNDPSVSVQHGVITHYASGIYGYAYRTERYRYTEWIDVFGIIQARELYDYEQDPMETINLAGEPGYAGLIYQFSRSMRDAGEAGGCERLKASDPAPATSTNLTLGGLKLNGDQLTWPDAAGITYHVLETSNLVDAVWTTNETVAADSYLWPMTNDTGFIRIDVAE